MRMRMGMGMGAWVQGDSASPGARCLLARHAIHHQSATRHTQQHARDLRSSSTTSTLHAAAKPAPSRPCFVRDAANGASADRQALRAPHALPWAHCGTEADGKVGTLELELACLLSLRAPLPQASQGPPR
jgi:hypothetical protein